MGILAVLLGMLQNQPALADTKDIIILDVRTLEEFEDSHITNAINVDFLSADFKNKIQKLDKNKSYGLYCRSGNRSGQASSIMKSLGFKKVENLGSLNQAAQRLNQTCEGKKC